MTFLHYDNYLRTFFVKPLKVNPHSLANQWIYANHKTSKSHRPGLNKLVSPDFRASGRIVFPSNLRRERRWREDP